MHTSLRREYLICYHIEANKTRTKLFKELRRNGLRHIQKSIFWGYLTRAELNAVRRFIDEIIDHQDRALIASTSISGGKESILFGYSEQPFKDWEENGVI